MNSSYGQWGGKWGLDLPGGPGAPGAPVEIPVPGESAGIYDLVAGYLPVAQVIADQLTDKYRAMGIAEQKLAQARAQGQSSAYIGRLEANYYAAKRAYEKQLEGEESTRQYRLLGQIGIVTGIGLGAAAIFYVLTRAFR